MTEPVAVIVRPAALRVVAVTVVRQRQQVAAAEIWKVGPPGASAIRELRYASAEEGGGVISYCGVAPLGSSETAAVWRISRIVTAADGTVADPTNASGVRWTDVPTATYS